MPAEGAPTVLAPAIIRWGLMLPVTCCASVTMFQMRRQGRSFRWQFRPATEARRVRVVARTKPVGICHDACWRGTSHKHLALVQRDAFHAKVPACDHRPAGIGGARRLGFSPILCGAWPATGRRLLLASRGALLQPLLLPRGRWILVLPTPAARRDVSSASTRAVGCPLPALRSPARRPTAIGVPCVSPPRASGFSWS